MKMKHFLRTCLLTTCLAIFGFTSYGQDKIYKTDGTIIDAKVKTVSEKSVIYKRFDNQAGPEYTIMKTDIAKIVYENGTSDFFDNPNKNTGSKKGRSKEGDYKKKYGDNIFSVTPVAYTAAVGGSINDVGIGLCYERFLDKRDRISFNLPVMLFFSSNKDYNNNLYYYNGTNVDYGSNYKSVYFMPGVKFYPSRHNEKVRYALGASFFCIFGSEPYGVYDNNGNGQYNNPTDPYHYAMYGLMISNSLNITATKHLYMALDLGTGIPIADNRYADNNDGLDIILGPFIQIGFKVGYRY